MVSFRRATSYNTPNNDAPHLIRNSCRRSIVGRRWQQALKSNSNMTQEFQDKVRIEVNRYIFNKGFAPTTLELSKALRTSEDTVKVGLRQLADNHAIVLHPNSFDIWAAQPFALFPTLFWVESGEKKWWGNCTWCSLGIASLTKQSTTIFTKVSGEEEPIRIDIIDNKVIQKDLLVHLPIPAKRFWDNVIYT